MKKSVVIAVAMLFFAGISFAADINIKAGLDLYGAGIEKPEQGKDWKSLTDTGFSLQGEVLFPVIPMLKVGGGIQYQLARSYDRFIEKFSYIPVFATAQVAPLKDCGIYVKGNIGYSLVFRHETRSANESTGGLYYGLGAGYDFKCGIIVEAMYDVYAGNIDWDGFEVDYGYSKLGLNIGYKFAI